MRDEYRRQVLNRWKSIEGHARAVRRMIEDDEYCPDIIKQTLAIQGAIDGVNALVLDNHLRTCATAAIQSDDLEERERMIGELLDLFRGGSRVGWNRSLPQVELSVLEGGRGAGPGKETS